MVHVFQTLTLLAAETAGEAAEGFNLLDFIKEKNLVNFFIVLGIVVYLASKAIPRILNERRQIIADEIEDATNKAKEAEKQLAAQKLSLANAQEEANRILSTARTNAQRVREEILQRTEADLQKLRQDAAGELTQERERVVAQLRRLTLEQTFRKVETDLPGMLNEDTQRSLIDQGLALMDRRNSNAG